MNFGIRIKYYQRLLSFKKAKYFPEAAQPEITELYWLDRDLNFNDNKHIVLSTTYFSFKEILDILYQNNQRNLQFYIHSHQAQKIIGDKGLVKLK